MEYAIVNDIKINRKLNPIIYAQEELEIKGNNDFYIVNPKDNSKKTPIQYAIDNNIKINDKDPKIWYEEWQKQQSQNKLKDQAKEIGEKLKINNPSQLSSTATKQSPVLKKQNSINREK